MPINITNKSKSKQINLIPQDEFETSNFGRILKWALSTFRIIVIVTELVVMSAFLSRFWLDAKNSDLNDELKVSKSQILAYKNIETEFRAIQEKILIAKTIYSKPKSSEIISEVTKIIPNDVTLSSIVMADNQINIKSTSFSEKSIAQFLLNAEKSKALKDTLLNQVSSNVGTDASTSFTITAKINYE